jgi:hypothetical protein
MMVVVFKIVTRKNVVMEMFGMNPFIVVYTALERNLPIGVLDEICTSEESNTSTVLW